MSDSVAAAPVATRSLDPTTRQVWVAVRGPALVVLGVLLAAVAVAALGGGSRAGLLDPRAVDPSGSRAVAEVLRDQGVQVQLVTTTLGLRDVAVASDTVLVAFPDQLLPEQAKTVQDTGADLVVVGSHLPEQFVDGVTAARESALEARQPVCALPVAEGAGNADTGGISYEVAPGAGEEADGCYARQGLPSVVQVRTGGRTVTLLGSPQALTNDRLDELGNAALSLGLLGQNSRLLWYLPSLADIPAGEQRSFYGLVPDGFWFGLGQAVVAVLVLMVWRARRLGPVVPEPLPVVVRAAETVEGRARLYRRAGARDKAAAALRAGALRRMIPLLGLPRRAEAAAVVDGLVARTRRAAPDLAALLYGAAPTDDAALVRLAGDLDALEREIRRP
ncbi:MAG: DUF4350 domain-containing protein [Sporichthyaceae bacterium]